MLHIQNQIKENPDRQLSEKGLAAGCIGVSRVAGNVSLRTQNKYFPDREPMVIGPLKSCDAAIRAGWGGTKHKALIKCRRFFVRLSAWLLKVSNLGCLLRNPRAACPEKNAIQQTTSDHKSRTRLPRIVPISNAEVLSVSLFVCMRGRQNPPVRPDRNLQPTPPCDAADLPGQAIAT